MKKWLCSVFGNIYDPEEEDIPAEIRGAAICRYVDGHDDPALGRGVAKRKFSALNRFVHQSPPKSGDEQTG